MKVRRLLCLAVVGLISAITARAAGDIDIPFTKFVLDNGLTLIVSEDHKAPIVGVNVWYHVGSKNEKEGKTGFAHLFEHLMFNGSENFNDDYFKAFDRVGATGMNGTTNFDRTNYFENVPNTALDTALWMESDRMGHLIGAVDQAKLDEQRGVVQNEKRQGENQPYGKAFINIFQSTYPKGHPYSWSVIGSMDDLNAASVEDVHQWFKRYYGAANAVIAIAGDVDTEEVHKKVEQYFGDIPAGPPVGRQESWVAKRTGSHRMVLQDRVPQARIYKAWNMPAWGTLDADYLGMVSNLLADGKTSRLYKRLVYDDRIATDVTSFSFDRELGGLFVIYATATPGQDLEKVEKAIDEELGKLLKEGPTARELQRVKTQYRARFVRGIERIGGFGGKSDILAMNEVYGGRPDFYKVTLQRVAEARESELKRAANDWLGDGDFTLEVRPFPKYKTIATNVDRSKVPEVASFPEVIFPRLRKTTLLNGTRVILVERHEVPVVNCRLAFDAGYAADHSAVPGTASLTLDMMDEGTTHRTALEISDELSMLGATLSSGSNLDMSIISLSALRENLDASLDIFSDVVRNPSFPEAEFARLKKEQLAKIQREKATPFQMALRVFPKLLYEEGHAYGTPFTGSGTEKSVNSLTPAKLRAFHDTWIRPNNATLIIVGDTTLREMKPKLERLFADWKSSKIPRKNLATVTQKKKSQVYIIDRPGSLQSIILAGHLIPPKANPDEIAIEAVNRVLGGGFTARINMNLREDKHWSYGARSIIPDARGQRPFLILAPVQTDRTKESMREIQKELEGITGVVPPTPEELDTAKDRSTKTLPGRWETSAAVLRDIGEI
ncbi:MAG: M16 family metallopeptidase, partial [Acidobacteriota bacterium]